MNVYFKAFLFWMLIIPLAIVNGIGRDTILTEHIGSHYALPISGILLSIVIFIVAYILIPKLGKHTIKTYLKIGILWMLLTILFETIFGLLSDNPIGKILEAYNFTTGNLWLLVVIASGVSPLIVSYIITKSQNENH